MFLASNGFADVREAFAIDQPLYAVLAGETPSELLSVFKQTTRQIIGHPDVENDGTAGENVNEVFAHERSIKLQRFLDKFGMTNKKHTVAVVLPFP